MVVRALVALVPPCPSVPPGAGNKPKKELKPGKRAQDLDEGYVGQTHGIDRDVHAPAIRRDDDGDLAAISGLEPAQSGLHVRRQGSCSVSAVYQGSATRQPWPKVLPGGAAAAHAGMTRSRSISQSVLRLRSSRSSGSVDGRSVGRPSR